MGNPFFSCLQFPPGLTPVLNPNRSFSENGRAHNFNFEATSHDLSQITLLASFIRAVDLAINLADSVEASVM